MDRKLDTRSGRKRFSLVRKLSRAFSFVRAVKTELRTRTDREYEMSFNRMKFLAVVSLYLACTRQPGFESGLIYIAFYSVFTAVTFISVVKDGRRNDIRRIVALIGDFVSISYEMHAGDAMTAVLIPIYLWVVFGNGFRFGVRFLFISAAAAIVTFVGVALTTPFWQEHTPMTVGCLLSLVILPAYVSTLIRQLSASTEQAQAANKSKTMFLASVSHELRTPLHTITNAAALLDGTPLDGDQKELTVTLINSARYLLSLIGDILDLSSMEANRAKPELAPTNVAELLMEAQSMVRLAASHKGLDLRLQVSPRLPATVMLDRKLVLQVLMNLVSNAMKFTAAGHITLCARPGLTSGTMQFEVADTGIGIAQASQSKIFDSFVQADHTIIDRFGGTGLGLSIAKQIVEAMDGSIEVESAPEKGSTFRIKLPMPKTNAGVQQPDRQTGTVVIVGGHADDGLRQHLDAIGMTAESADSVEHGVEMVRSAREAGLNAFIAATPEDILAEGQAPITPALLRDLGAMLLTPQTDAVADRGDQNCLPTYISPASTPEELRAAFRVISTLSGTPLVAAETASRIGTRKLSVLVADDNKVNRRIMERILTNAGHRTAQAVNGEEVLDILEREIFDLVLMDVNMPLMNGIEATKLYRFTEPYGQRTPIVALTADATKEMAQRCADAGMDGVVTKPVEPRKIMALIEEYAKRGEKPAAIATETPVELAYDVVLPVLDKKTQDGLRRLGGDAFAHEVSTQFLVEAMPLLDTLRQAGEARDIGQFRFDAHAIRSSARNVGAKSVADFAEAAETLPEASFDKDAMRLAGRIEIELKRLQRELDNSAPAYRAEGPQVGH